MAAFDMHAPVFVVGTGRCGSTMVSNLLNGHPRVLSVSEFFTSITDLGGRITEAFPEGSIDGADFWRIIAAVPPKLATMMRHGAAMDEVLYRPSPGARFTADGGVPAILQTTLPHLTPEHDALFAALEGYVTALSPAPVGEQYSRLFAELARRFGRTVWVERSGGSLRLASRLRRAFPSARFVHIVRDGRDCAISMSKHYGFRMALVAMQLTEILGVDPFESRDRAWEPDVPDELVPFLPERFDGEAFRRYETPLPLCGHYWSGEIAAGLTELADVAPGRLLTLRYEDFLEEPYPTIGRLLTFLGPDYVDDAWARRAALHVGRPRSAWGALAEPDLRALTDACRPGFDRLDAHYPSAPLLATYRLP
jgi:hypothetical protein